MVKKDRLTRLAHHWLGLKIDDDLRVNSRYELCQRIEETFGLEKETFWYLPSTQKIRFSVQKARELMDE